MESAEGDRLGRFKKRIDFDAALAAEPQDRMVFLTWPEMLEAPGLSEEGWSLFADGARPAAGGSQRSWILHRGQETVVVIAFVAAKGVEAARRYLLTEASNTATVEVPYERGPAGLGTLSIEGPGSSSLRWVYRNVCVAVRGIDTRLALLPIARWLQARVEASLVHAESPRLRTLPALRVSRRRAAVGQSVELGVEADPADPASRYVLKLAFDRKAIEMSSLPGPRAVLKGLAAGRIAVEVHLIDSATLVSSTTHLDLEFGPGASG